LNLGVEEDFWNHNFSGESGEIIRRIKKESSKDLENKKFCNNSMYVCMYLVVLVQQEGKKKGEESGREEQQQQTQHGGHCNNCWSFLWFLGAALLQWSSQASSKLPYLFFHSQYPPSNLSLSPLQMH
jgi:hypothetical protein